MKESAMANAQDTNKQSRLMWTVLAILGAMLAVVGWYRWAM
jgi:hypothetical protein